MKRVACLTTVIGAVLAMALLGCSEEADQPATPQENWSAERLQPGFLISFTSDYVGNGYRCGIDACYFDKQTQDHSISFNFPVYGMTGHVAAEFDELPEAFLYKYRELIRTKAGLEGALYFTPQDENDVDWSSGAFVVEKPDTPGYREVLWIIYKQPRHDEVRRVLETVELE